MSLFFVPSKAPKEKVIVRGQKDCGSQTTTLFTTDLREPSDQFL